MLARENDQGRVGEDEVVVWRDQRSESDWQWHASSARRPDGDLDQASLHFRATATLLSTPGHGPGSKRTAIQRTPTLEESTCSLYTERKGCENRQDPLRRQESWSERYARPTCPSCGTDPCIADYEVSLLRLLERITNGTIIEISVTGAFYTCLTQSLMTSQC